MFLRAAENGRLYLHTYIQPKGSKNRFVGLHDGVLKLSVTAPPVDNKANKAVCSFLAKQLGLAKKDVLLISGNNSRKKTFQLLAISEEEVRARVLEKIEK